MKINEVNSKGLEIEWNVTIPSNQVDFELKKKYQEISVNAKIPGFRQGKVPIEIIKKRYSRSVIPDVLDGLVNKTLREEVTKRKLKPSVQPKVEIKSFEEGKDLIFNVSFQTMPEVPVIDFKNIEIEKSNLKVSESDIQNTLDEIAKKHERFSPLKNKRKSKMTDLILFDYEGKIDGKKFQNGSGKDETVVLGSNKYIPGYEDQMVGMEINESREINVKFPEDYRDKKIANKKAKFFIKVKDIQEKVSKIEIDNKLAEELGEKDIVSLKTKVEERMKNDFNQLSNLKMRRELSEKLLTNYNFEIPTKMVDEELVFLKQQSKDKKDAELKKLALRRVKLGLIINSVSEQNKINIDDSDLTKAVVEEARRHPGREKEVVEFYKSNPAMMSNLRGVALEEKVMGFIINSCTKKNKDCTMDDLFKSNFLKEEKETISKNKKEKKK